ncbi:hypothetical protein SprV_0200686800 [Sparganum proliferum]
MWSVEELDGTGAAVDSGEIWSTPDGETALECGRSLIFLLCIFYRPLYSEDETMDTLSSRSVTVDESQYRSKGNMSKRLKDRFLRVSIKVNPRQKDPSFEFKEKKGEFKEHRV